jgi:ADP-heptose:LPS heptosyltransferase
LNFEPGKILVIDFGQLGDVILSLPALTAIARKFPEAKISIVVGSACVEILNMQGMFDEVFPVDRVGLLAGSKVRSSIQILKFAREIRQKKFDFVIDLHSLPETNLLGFISGAKTRLFANRESRSLDLLSNFRPKPPKEDKSLHLTDYYLAVLKPLGIDQARRAVNITPGTEDLAFARDLLTRHGLLSKKIIGICPGAGHPSRRWPLEKYCNLAKMLSGQGELGVVVFLGPEELTMMDEIEGMLPDEVAVVNGLTMSQLAAVFSLVSLIVGNDTGTMHVANAVGAPVVVLLNEVSPERYMPISDNLCMIRRPDINDIEEDEVSNAIFETLGNISAKYDSDS